MQSFGAYGMDMRQSFFGIIAGCVAALSPCSAMAQDAVTIKAGTPLVLALSDPLTPSKAKPGDPVSFTLALPLRVDGRLIAKAGTPVLGHVLAVDPELVIRMQALNLGKGTVDVPMAGNPFQMTKGRLAQVKMPDPPKELNSYGHVDAGDVAMLAAVGVIAVPLVAIAAPFWLVSSVAHAGHEKKAPAQLVYPKGKLVQVAIEKDVVIPSASAGPDESYRGPPVIYVVDRYYSKRSDIACGRDVLLGKPEQRTNLYRVEEGTYPFHTKKEADLKASFEAKVDHRYLVYRDSDGLHSVPLDARPDLLDRLPAVNATTHWNFDILAAEPAQQQSVADDRARGGCGIVKMLHTRPSGPTPVN